MAKQAVPAINPTLKLITLEPTMFVFEEGKVKFFWPWGKPTVFPLAKYDVEFLTEMLEAGTIGLCYITGTGRKSRAIAIDALYPRGGFHNRGPALRSARLLGDLQKVPAAKESATAEIFLWPTAGPRRQVNIKVIKHRGEQLFEAEGVRFDSLDAFDEFMGGVLRIYRDGKLHDQTADIDWYGTHGACNCFQGFSKPFEGDTSPRYAISGVGPEDFKVGDELVLEYDVPLDQSFDFATFLRVRAGLLSALIHSFDDKKELSMKELGEQFGARAGSAVRKKLTARVVRFRGDNPKPTK